VLGFAFAQPCQAGISQITIGHARFTIITPNLIRLQYSNGGEFTDAPTLFAADRAARYDGATVVHTNSGVSISTSAFQLNYHADGKPFDAANLNVFILARQLRRWTPGMDDPLNLGGTLRTLDGCSGPRDLGQGLISRSGWTVVDDSGSPVLTSDWVESRPNKAEKDWYLFAYGLDYKAALKSLAAISGPVPLPRKNLLGVWYSRYWPYSADEFRQIVQEYSDHGFPLDNIVMDMDWHITHIPGDSRPGQIWTGYTWDRNLIPDPQGLLRWFHQQGLHVTLNDHPAEGVQPHERSYADFMRAMGADAGENQTLPFDAGDKKYLDTFYEYTHAPLERMGVDFWWLDWQQSQFTLSVPELSNLAWLNRYYFLHAAEDGKRGASFSRWGGWGDQRYPIHFSGDANTSWAMLGFEVPFTSTAGNVGCFYWSHDIGGHLGGRNEESYTRWCQFGAISAALRSHSTRDATMDRRPWTYPKWAEDSMRKSFRLRAQLMPYIYSSAAETCREMVPLLRPMYFEHPDLDPAYHNAQEYYFGDNILAAPIASPGQGPTRMAWQSVWFPAGSGVWYDYFTGERHDGDTTAIVAADIDQFPLFIRGGVPIPMQPYTPRPTSAVLNRLILRCYPGEIGEKGTSLLYEDDGQTQKYENGAFADTKLTYSRGRHSTSIEVSPTQGHFDGQELSRTYQIELCCVEPAATAEVDGVGAEFSYDPATSTAKIEIPPHRIESDVKVIVRCGIVDAESIHREAVAQRLSGIVGHAIESGSIREMVSRAMDAIHDPGTAAAVLASAGAAVMHTNDGPYLYDGHEAFRVFVPPGILDSSDATAWLKTQGKATMAIPVQLADGSTLDMDFLSKQLPDEDSIIVPGRYPNLSVAMRIDRKMCEFELPAPGVAPVGVDLARSAHATATSCENDYDPSGAIDGRADGYPNDKRYEWSSNHEKAGAAITLTWDTAQTVSRLLLYDRPNLTDQVLAGRIVFSDGRTIPFGELPNDGKTPVSLVFPPRVIRWLRLEINRVSATTQNAGIAEIGVFR
jgi:alpha-glucosidase (family GH31 glycosyl hydrolase)